MSITLLVQKSPKHKIHIYSCWLSATHCGIESKDFDMIDLLDDPSKICMKCWKQIPEKG